MLEVVKIFVLTVLAIISVVLNVNHEQKFGILLGIGVAFAALFNIAKIPLNRICRYRYLRGVRVT